MKNHQNSKKEGCDSQLGQQGSRKKRAITSCFAIVSESTRSYLGNLSDVLADEDLAAEFNEHLRTEFSVENMLFYKRTKAFAQECLQGAIQSVFREEETSLVLFG